MSTATVTKILPLLVLVILARVLLVSLSTATYALAQSGLTESPLDVMPEEAAQLLKDNPDIVVLDVRTPVEFYVSHIENAININYYSFSFKSQIEQLDRSKTYILHCQTGVRSGKTIPIMTEAGFTSIYHLNDGFRAWKQANLPTTS